MISLTAGAKSNAVAFSPSAAATPDSDPTDIDFWLYSAVREEDSPTEMVSIGEDGLRML